MLRCEEEVLRDVGCVWHGVVEGDNGNVVCKGVVLRCGVEKKFIQQYQVCEVM